MAIRRILGDEMRGAARDEVKRATAAFTSQSDAFRDDGAVEDEDDGKPQRVEAEDYARMKIKKQLEAACEKRGISSSGDKQQLITRLQKYDVETARLMVEWEAAQADAKGVITAIAVDGKARPLGPGGELPGLAQHSVAVQAHEAVAVSASRAI